MGSMQKISPATGRGGVEMNSLKGQQVAFPQDQPCRKGDEEDDEEDACLCPVESFGVRAVGVGTEAA